MSKQVKAAAELLYQTRPATEAILSKAADIKAAAAEAIEAAKIIAAVNEIHRTKEPKIATDEQAAAADAKAAEIAKIADAKAAEPKTKAKKVHRKLSAAGKARRAERLLKAAEIAVREMELANNPAMIAMNARLEAIKPVLAIKKAEYAKARENKADALLIAKLKVSVLSLQAEQAKLKEQIDNCLNPKPPRAKKETKTEADKLSMTNLQKLSVSHSKDTITY